MALYDLAMKSTEILDFVKNQLPYLTKHFKGVYSRDKIPRLHKLELAIINTAPSTHQGKHWFAICRCNDIEIFDSLGIEEVSSLIVDLKERKGEIEYNVSQLQSDKSALCGEYCLYFFFHRMTNLDMDFEELIEDIFTSNVEENDVRVKEFFHFV